MHFPKGRVTPTQKVQTLAAFRVGLYGLLQVLDCGQLPIGLLSKTVNSVVHPSQLALDIGPQVVWQFLFLQEGLVGLTCCSVLILELVQMSNMESYWKWQEKPN